MTSIRKTISLPPAAAKRLDREAKRRHKSASAVITELLGSLPEGLPYAGLIDDDANLSLQVEEILSRTAAD